MKRYTRCITALIFSISLVLGLYGQPLQIDNEESFHVYILTGQSNSLGTTASSDELLLPPDNPRDTRISFYWSNVDASNNSYPPKLYGSSQARIKSLGVQQGDDKANPTLWGPEIEFARTLDAANDDQRILIIKASRGGGGNKLWDKDVYKKNANAGHMWGHLCDTVDGALAALLAEGHTFKVRGLLYMQGESNSLSDAAIADTRLSKFFDNLRQHIEKNYPGSTGQMKAVIGEIAASQNKDTRKITTEKQAHLAASRDEFIFVKTRDLPLKADGIHFGGNEKLEIGRRFARAIQNTQRHTE